MEWIRIKDKLPTLGEIVLLDRDICSYGWLVRLSNETHAWIIYTPNGYILMSFLVIEKWSPFPKQPERLNEMTSKDDAIV